MRKTFKMNKKQKRENIFNLIFISLGLIAADVFWYISILKEEVVLIQHFLFISLIIFNFAISGLIWALSINEFIQDSRKTNRKR